jgi:hypothetical protein
MNLGKGYSLMVPVLFTEKLLIIATIGAAIRKSVEPLSFSYLLE